MRKGSKIPFSFAPGDRVVDDQGKICVVETWGHESNIFMVFDPYEGLVKFDFKHRYKPLNQNIITCILGFLKRCL